MGDNPSRFRGCARCPVENVSWDDVQEFLGKLNELTGKRYRLPTEAEWEYAARGGQRGRGYQYAGDDDLNRVAWYRKNSRRTRPVARKQPNELGLYDMSGNVFEWVQDCWHDSYGNAPRDGTARGGVGVCRLGVTRGGAWFLHEQEYFRVASRYKEELGKRFDALGFRTARTPEP